MQSTLKVKSQETRSNGSCQKTKNTDKHFRFQNGRKLKRTILTELHGTRESNWAKIFKIL